MERYIQLNNQIISRKLTQSLLCTPTYTTLVSDWIRTGLLASVISSQPLLRLNLSLPYTPPTYHQRFWLYVNRLTPKRTAMNRP